MMFCKLCHQNKKLIKSHIIPKSFYKAASDGKPHKLISDEEGVYPKKSPSGIYDKKIVCCDCEKAFSSWDGYGSKFLNSDVKEDHKVFKDNIWVAYKYDNVNYEMLKLFFISLLWRAGVSEHPFFQNVHLGDSQEKLLRKMINDRDPNSSEVFGIVATLFDHDLKGLPTLDWRPVCYEQIAFMRIYIGLFRVEIKMDEGRMPPLFEPFVLSPTGEMMVYVKKYSGSKESFAAECIAGKAY